MKFQLKEKEETCEKLELEVISLKDKLKKSNTWLKFEKSIETLNEILSFQMSPFINTGCYAPGYVILSRNKNITKITNKTT
jgi:hypothetical protein